MPMPTVIECKRRRFVSDYERSGEDRIRRLFEVTAKELQKVGVYGVFEVEFVVEISAVSYEEFVSHVIRQARYGIEGAEVGYSWGSAKFTPLEKRVHLAPTRLYSPSYLETVFNWNCEASEYDGIVCESHQNGELMTNLALEPVAIKWRSRSAAAQIKKQRAIGAMLGDAISQVPAGELGIIYVCYQEGSSTDIADERSQRIKDELSNWSHWGEVYIPAIFINRLYARTLNEGNPDLIENVLTVKPCKGHPSIFELFPAQVFTPA